MKLRKRLDEATEGPWKADGSFDDRGFVVSGPVEGGPNGGQFKRAWTRWGVDADLICDLRNTAPLMLDVIDAARVCAEHGGGAESDVEALEAALARLDSATAT